MASGTTTISSLPYPLTTDAPNVSSDIEALANALDGKAIATSGNLSGRPSSSLKLGQRYYATDNHTMYQSDGTNWFAMRIGGAWTSLTIAGGFSSPGSPLYAAAYRISGDTVELRGGITGTVPGTEFNVASGLPVPALDVQMSTIAQVALSFIPALLHVDGTVASGTGSLRVDMNSSTGSLGVLALDGVSYSLV